MSDVTPTGPEPARFAPPQPPPPGSHGTPPAYAGPPVYEPPVAFDPSTPPPPPPGAPPPPLVGTGSAGHYGAPVDLASTPRPVAGPVPAPFVRRLAAAVVTNLAFVALAAPGIWVIAWLTGFADRNTATCTVGAVLTVCESNGWARLAGAVVALAFTATLSYLLFGRPLHVHRGTVGMRQTGLVARRVADHGSADVGHARLHWLGSSMPQTLSGLIVGIAWTDLGAGIWTIAALVQGVAVLFTLGGALAAVMGHRTLWDRWSGMEVVAEREVAWVAIAAVAVGSLIPILAFGALALSDFDDLRDRYAELTSSTTDTSTLLLVLVPVATLSVVTIVLGQIGIHVTRWSPAHPAGDGAARAGALLGWSIPAAVVIAVVVNLTTDRVESLNESGCREARADIEVAIASYRTLNGSLPASLGDLSSAVYLGEAPDPERWEYGIDAAAPEGFRLTGTGDCEPD